MNGTRATELLEATRNFLLESILPNQEGFLAYSTRVAANNLAIVSRELELRGGIEKLDEGINQTLSLQNKEGPTSTTLARGLRDGIIQADDDLIKYLRQRTMLCMEIDNPRYSGLLLAKDRWEKGDAQE